MKILETIFVFRGWRFTFTPVGKKRLGRTVYKKWKVIVEWRGKKYRAYYLSFVPSAFICRQLKKTKGFLNHPIK